jgi:hypothetical protein
MTTRVMSILSGIIHLRQGRIHDSHLPLWKWLLAIYIMAEVAVHIGARVAALAAPGEVLVSSTVKDLVAGSGLRFRERGSTI